jgi:Ni,Fe-hydrogenase maturation factor
MRRALIIGYGNLDGLDELGHDVDTVFLQQLTPELAEIVTAYQEVIFVDAHVLQYAELLREVMLDAVERRSTLVSHHLHPGALLALTESLWGHTPRARLISVRGYDFDFGTQLSDKTSEGAELAIVRIWGLVNQLDG